MTDAQHFILEEDAEGRPVRTSRRFQAHEMTLDERRALVIKDIKAESEEDLLLARTETVLWLGARLNDFMLYLEVTGRIGATDYQQIVKEYIEGIEDAESMESFDVPGWVPESRRDAEGNLIEVIPSYEDSDDILDDVPPYAPLGATKDTYPPLGRIED